MSPEPGSATPPIVDPETWERERRELLAREKAHTREGDAISAAYRRLPMTEVDANAIVQGPDGPVRFLDVFEGRDQLIVYTHMWHAGRGIAGQCMGCTASVYSIHDAVYLHHRGVSFAVFTKAPVEDIAEFRAFMGYTVPWYSILGLDSPGIGGGYIDTEGYLACYLRVGDRVYLTNEVTSRGVEGLTMVQAHLLDATVYGRQEEWEDSPAGWPKHPTGTWWVRDGRPVPQWSRPGAADQETPHEHHHH